MMFGRRGVLNAFSTKIFQLPVYLLERNPIISQGKSILLTIDTILCSSSLELIHVA